MKEILKDMERQIKGGISNATPDEMKAMGFEWNEKTKAWKKGKNEIGKGKNAAKNESYFRLYNRWLKLFYPVDVLATSAEEACAKVGWDIEETWVRVMTFGKYSHGWSNVTPKEVRIARIRR